MKGTETRGWIAVGLVFSLAGCAAHRPVTTGGAPGAESSSSDAGATPGDGATRPAAAAPAPGVDRGPVADWYRAREADFELNPAARPEDLSFTMSLLRWLAFGDEQGWERIAERVERSFRDPAPALRPQIALRTPRAEEAQIYHEAARPLSSRPQAERNPADEELLYRKALLLNPGSADLINHVAVDRSLSRDYVNAERLAKLAIALDPGFISAYQELAYVYKKTERYQDCIDVAQRGLEVDGDLHTKALLLARQGQAYWLLGNEGDALSRFKTSRRLGGPPWVDSYLEGRQQLGKEYLEPVASPSAQPESEHKH